MTHERISWESHMWEKIWSPDGMSDTFSEAIFEINDSTSDNSCVTCSRFVSEQRSWSWTNSFSIVDEQIFIRK